VKIFKIYLFLVCLSINYTVFAQKSIEIIKFQDLEQLMQKDDGIYVFNFWASWCKPCVTEMPAFETLANDLRLNKVSVIFISLDFKRDFETVEMFVSENQIKCKLQSDTGDIPVHWKRLSKRPNAGISEMSADTR